MEQFWLKVGSVFYNFFSQLLPAIFRFAALWNPKAQKWVEGRKNIFQDLERKRGEFPGKLVWFHCASLGEFEQARPVIEDFRKAKPDWVVLLSFFSPSGYEVRKKYNEADIITYLPADTAENANQWLNILKPNLVMFVKYEFWPHYLNQVRERDIPAICFSAIFRPKQFFFKPYGALGRKTLASFQHIFTQDHASATLLQNAGINNVSVAGDTRFDRVWDISQKPMKLPIIEIFKGHKELLVAGSAWPEDINLIFQALGKDPTAWPFKIAVAPHEINEEHLNQLLAYKTFQPVLYTKATTEELQNANLLIIDTIGILSSVYAKADYAYVGGALGPGLHNVLEPAVFGLPVSFGNKNFQKFREARELLASGGAFATDEPMELKDYFLKIISPKNKKAAGEASREYCLANQGAKIKVLALALKWSN